MSEYTAPGPVTETAGIREAVCIHTKKIFDSCREQDTAPLWTGRGNRNSNPCILSHICYNSLRNPPGGRRF